MTYSSQLRSRLWMALGAGVLVLALAGCSALTLLASYAAAASTIKSLLDDDDPQNPTYELSGYVYIDHTNNQIAIQATPTAPPEGSFVPFADATVSIDTTPPRTQKTNNQGYFRWTGIPDTRVVLTVLIPDAEAVQFDVKLDSGFIEPRAEN
ncbi:MAG: hypothetical protein GX100_05680 [candidate division WS1 bacterium]|nr:hypothetical protein [candidate division WS1 bacterium]